MKWWKILFSVVGLFPVSAFAVESYPTNAVAFVQLDSRRVNLWANKFNDVSKPLKSLCWVMQPDFNFFRPCIRKLSRDDVFILEVDKELAQQLAEANDPPSRDHLRNRLSLFDEPIPLAPAFGWPQKYLHTKSHIQAETEIKITPLEQLTSATQSDSFDSIPNLSFVIGYSWAFARSFENVNLSAALQAAWDFWERAAEQGKVVCVKNEMPVGCLRAVRVHSSKPSIEPVNFLKGVALCTVDPPNKPNPFLVHCSLMTMETRDHQKYMQSIVAPTMAMGGGTDLVDSFGTFQLACSVSRGNAKKKLTDIKATFELTGAYKLEDTIDVVAYSRFQRFEAANRYGRFKMEIHGADANATSLQILFFGKWWRENRDENAIPVFEDDDVYKFKSIFENAVNGKCDIVPKRDLLTVR